MAIVVDTLAYATLLLDITILAGIGIYGAKKLFGFNPEILTKIENRLSNYYMELSFILATVATTGSLYLSNALQWEPCRLCWFQRILMYPLVLITGVGLLFNDENARDYALPLAMIGLPLSFYHTLVQRYQQFQSAGCSITSVSCEAANIPFRFGYVTIPVMAFTVFLGILILMWKFNGRQG